MRKNYDSGMLDIGEPRLLEVVISHNRTTIWINDENGQCVFRAYRIGALIVDDTSKEEGE